MAAPPELLWYLVRNHHSRLLKRNNIPQPLSTEPFNVRNLHTSRDSGFVRPKGVDIREKGGAITVTVRGAKKGNKPSAATTSSVVKTHARAGARSVVGVSQSHRSDLASAARTRYSRVKSSQNKKPVGIKKHSQRRKNPYGRKSPDIVG